MNASRLQQLFCDPTDRDGLHLYIRPRCSQSCPLRAPMKCADSHLIPTTSSKLLLAYRLSGKRVLLPARAPLRTGRASRLASGSSHSSAPWGGTGQPDGMFRGSTAGKVGRPCRVKRIGRSTNLYVTRNRDRHCSEQPKAGGAAASRTLRRKVPRPWSVCPEVSPPDPPCSFRGMPTRCPLPEQSPDVRVDQ
jgi:hypothetical protein